MKINVCKRCHGLFESDNLEGYCPLCKQAINRKFSVVKTFVRRHKNADLNEVSIECAVPVSQLLKWVREERLYFDKDSKVALPCLNCGTLIQTGEYCQGCKVKMFKMLKGVAITQPKFSEEDKVVASVGFHGSKRLRNL